MFSALNLPIFLKSSRLIRDGKTPAFLMATDPRQLFILLMLCGVPAASRAVVSLGQLALRAEQADKKHKEGHIEVPLPSSFCVSPVPRG